MQVSVYIKDEKLINTLKKVAEQKKRSVSYIITEMVTDGLEWLDSPYKKAKKMLESQETKRRR